MSSFLIKIFFFLIILSWNNVSNSVEVLGTGTGALLGGDLTDPEDDGIDEENTNWNWTSIDANSTHKSWSGEGAYNVFDNKVGSSDDKWCCKNGFPFFLSVGFSQPYVLSHFTIASGNDVPGRDPDVWKIQGSNDGNNWTDIFVYNNDGVSPWGSDRLEVLRYNGNGDDFNTPNAYSYFRYYATSSVSVHHQINEIEYFGNVDTTNPTLTSSVPADNATGVALDANIVLNFDEFVDAETGNITIKKTSDNSIVETIDVTSGQVSGSGTAQITINPSANLDGSTEYYILIDATAFDDVSGNSYAGISSTTALSFTTVDTTGPSLTSSVPADNATGIAPDANIILNFSESVDAESGNISIYKSIDGSLVEEIDVTGGQVSGSGSSQITVNPSSDLESGVEYYILIDATAFDDSTSNSYAGISNSGDLSFRVLTSSNPLEDKNLVELLNVQKDISNIVLKNSIVPVSNRLKYLRRNRNIDNLSNQNAKIKLTGNYYLRNLINAYSNPIPISSKIEEKVLPEKWSSWSEGLYNVTTIGDDRNTNSRKIRSNSFAFGIDKKVSKNQFYGYAFQYGMSNSNITKTGTSVDSENYHFSWYGSKPFNEKNFIEGSVGFGLLETDLIRKKDTNRLTGSRNGEQVFGTINYGRTLQKGSIEIIPTIGLDLGYTELSAYTETGTDALSYSSQFIRSGLLTLGFELNNLIQSQYTSLKTFGTIDYGLDFSDTSEAKLNYLSDTSTIYTYKGSNNSSHWIMTEFGFDYIVKDTLIISSSYARNQGSDDEHSDTVKFRFYFAPERETEYAMQLEGTEDLSAGLNIAKNINGLDFNFKLDQEFNENLDKNAEISMIKKF